MIKISNKIHTYVYPELRLRYNVILSSMEYSRQTNDSTTILLGLLCYLRNLNCLSTYNGLQHKLTKHIIVQLLITLYM